MNRKKYKSVSEFWPYYVLEHRRPLTRWLHFVGNTNLLIWLLAAVVRRDLRMIFWAVVTSYAWAWSGHFFVERNAPATFRYPVLAAICDMIMYVKMWQGTMDSEVAQITIHD